ncbi:MAG: hypothetical protein HQL39_13310, partial [Alphaproteobacteria bacterium]|nr:hypothetical protein [Alphaproteobacteria bacterium]
MPRLNARSLLRPWHAVLAGGFLVAWATGDEDYYSMHVFAALPLDVAENSDMVPAWA